METVNTLDARSFRHLITTIGELPTSFIDSMSYYEMIAWLVDYIKREIIPAINNNAEAVKAIQAWIETLDLQDEVDNKLDEMAESGELTEIIAQYVNLGAVLAFDTVADLAASENVVAGSVARTLGRLTYNDTDGAYYKVRAITNDDTVDGVNLVAITHDNTLVAEKIPVKPFKGVSAAPYNIYVDSVNGDDTNTGDSSHPLKTINAAVDLAGNYGLHTEFRILLSTGNYNFNVFNMSNLSFHFGHNSNDMTSGNINITFTNPNSEKYDVAIYNCHFNFNGTQTHPLVINFSNADGMYFDNCQGVANYTTFNGRVKMWAGEATFSHCVLPSSDFVGANALIFQSTVGFINATACHVQLWQCEYDTTVDSSTYEVDQPNYLIYMDNVNLNIFGTSSIHYDDVPSIANFARVAGGKLTLQAMLNVKSGDTLTPFTGTIDIVSSIVVSTVARYNAFKQHGTTVNVSSDCILSDGLSE